MKSKYNYSLNKRCECGQLICNHAKKCFACSNKKLFNEKKYMQEYYKLHEEQIKKYHKSWYLKNTKECAEKNEKYQEMHKKEHNISSKKYRKTHKERITKHRRDRRKIDIDFKLLECLRSRMNTALRGNPKLETTIQLVDCSLKQLKQHLEKQFKPGMSWANYGTGWNGKGMQEWNVDHIKPCASFDLSKLSEQSKCFHYTNLQPMWALKNWEKNDKIIKEVLNVK